MLTTEDRRFAVDDARRKHQAIVDLIAAGDRQAIGFLQLYIALAVAALSSGAAALLSQAVAVPRPISVGLIGFGLTIALAALATLVVLWPSNIRLAGREPEFWEWAEQNQVSMDQTLRAYLVQIGEDIAINRRTNARMGRAMLLAKCLGAMAPVIGAISGEAAILLRL